MKELYRCIDEKHNVWQCRVCDHIVAFEADGPFENGWNRCPGCGEELREEDADGCVE